MTLNLALVEPDIAGNTGAIMRLCAALGLRLHLIEPLGFVLDDRRLTRSAMDYLDHLDMVRHSSWNEFVQNTPGRRVLMETDGAVAFHDFAFRTDDILIAGSESHGASAAVRAACDATVVIPLRPPARSLNVAMAAAIVVAEALRQTKGFDHETRSSDQPHRQP